MWNRPRNKTCKNRIKENKTVEVIKRGWLFLNVQIFIKTMDKMIANRNVLWRFQHEQRLFSLFTGAY